MQCRVVIDYAVNDGVHHGVHNPVRYGHHHGVVHHHGVEDGVLHPMVHRHIDYCVYIAGDSHRVCVDGVDSVYYYVAGVYDGLYGVVYHLVADRAGDCHARQCMKCVNPVEQRHKLIHIGCGHRQRGIICIYQSVVGHHNVEGAEFPVAPYGKLWQAQHHHRLGHVGLVGRVQGYTPAVFHVFGINNPRVRNCLIFQFHQLKVHPSGGNLDDAGHAVVVCRAHIQAVVAFGQRVYGHLARAVGHHVGIGLLVVVAHHSHLCVAHIGAVGVGVLVRHHHSQAALGVRHHVYNKWHLLWQRIVGGDQYAARHGGQRCP